MGSWWGKRGDRRREIADVVAELKLIRARLRVYGGANPTEPPHIRTRTVRMSSLDTYIEEFELILSNGWVSSSDIGCARNVCDHYRVIQTKVLAA